MLFDKLYESYLNYYLLKEDVMDEVPRKVLGMSTNVQDLPDEQPYGFWVDRSGNFLQVRTYGHDEGLENILSKAKEFLDKKGITFTPRFRYSTMYSMGWIRVVMHSKKIYYQTGNFTKQPTTSQMKFLKTLEMLYETQGIQKDDSPN